MGLFSFPSLRGDWTLTVDSLGPTHNLTKLRRTITGHSDPTDYGGPRRWMSTVTAGGDHHAFIRSCNKVSSQELDRDQLRRKRHRSRDFDPLAALRSPIFPVGQPSTAHFLLGVSETRRKRKVFAQNKLKRKKDKEVAIKFYLLYSICSPHLPPRSLTPHRMKRTLFIQLW